MNSWDEYVSVTKYKRVGRNEDQNFEEQELEELKYSVCKYALSCYKEERIYLTGGNQSASQGDDSEGEESSYVHSLDLYTGKWRDEP